MFSLPRDTVDVPIPPGPARSVFGSAYRGKINSWFATDPATAPTCSPGNEHDPRLQRAQGDPRRPLRARHQVLRRGQLRRLQEGRRRDRRRDRSTSRSRSRTTAIPGDRRRARAGLHPERHPAHGRRRRRSATRGRATASNDFDRGAAPAARPALAARAGRPAGPHPAPARARSTRSKSAVRTDIPVNQLAPLLGLASSVDTKDIRSYVFAPPFYQTEYPQQPARLHHRPERRQDPGRGQDRVHDQTRPTRPSARSSPSEGAGVWVLNGAERSHRPGPDLAGYLEYHGLAASAPRQRPAGARPRRHDDRGLQRRRGRSTPTRSRTSSRRFGVTGRRAKTDPAIRTDIIVTIGRSTPHLERPGRTLTLRR